MENEMRNRSGDLEKCHDKYGYKLGADTNQAIAVIKKSADEFCCVHILKWLICYKPVFKFFKSDKY